MSKVAKATLLASFVASTTIIWGVHFLQKRESDVRISLSIKLTRTDAVYQTMYAGVLRDDERRKEKMRRREEELEESMKKRAIYERVQHVTNAPVDGLSPSA